MISNRNSLKSVSKEEKRLKTAEKEFLDQISGAHSTQKLVEIHNKRQIKQTNKQETLGTINKRHHLNPTQNLTPLPLCHTKMDVLSTPSYSTYPRSLPATS